MLSASTIATGWPSHSIQSPCIGGLSTHAGICELAETRHVGGGEDADHAWHGERLRGIDASHPSRGNRSADSAREQRAFGIDVRSVFGRAAHLDRTFDARVGGADAHAFAPASTMARAAALTASGTL